MKKQSFIHGSIILIASVIIAKLIGAVFKIPLTNLLGGTGMGYFSSAYGLFLPVYAISVTGLTSSIAKLTAESSVFKMYRNVRKVKNISLITFFLIGLFGSITILLLAKPFAVNIIKSEKSYLSILMIAPSILFGCITAVYRGYFEGLRNMYPTAISQIAEALVKLVCGLGLCYYVLNNSEKVLSYFPDKTDITAVAAAAAVLGVTLSSLAGTIYIVLRYRLIGDGISKAELDKDKSTYSKRKICKELFKIMIPVSIGALVINLTSLIDLATIIRFLNQAIENSPKFFINKYPIADEIGLEELSNFVYGSFTGLAITVFNLVPSITNMFGKGVFPNIAESWAEKNTETLKKHAESALMVTGFIAIPSGFGICVLSKEILTFLYPSRLDEVLVSYESLIYLGIGVIMLALSFPVFSMLQAIGRADIPVKIMLTGVVIKFIGNMLLIPIPKINVSGAGISTLICYFVILVLSIFAFCKETKVKLQLCKIFLSPLYAGLLCASTALLSNSIISRFIDSKIVLPFSIMLGGGMYLLALWLMNADNYNLKLLLSTNSDEKHI
ncbi:MAG: polysaccharide biosynthesis protein [Clostridiales bacterium]|nr:polysaccharide biosynthesis protein [Clostridiales bacterium]